MSDKNEFQEWIRNFKVEIDPDQVEASFQNIQEQVKKLAADGRYTKVRIKFRGKAISPDIPLGVFIAAEAAAFWYAGLMRILAFNVGVRSFVEVEFIHQADEKIAEGMAAYADGEIDEAETAYREALAMSPEHPGAHYRLGVLLRVSGRSDEARSHLGKAAATEGFEHAEKAQEALDRMDRKGRTL